MHSLNANPIGMRSARCVSHSLKVIIIQIPVPSWYGWQYESPGIQVQSGPNQLLTATSSCAVTVIANNFDSSTHQGDSFLVLPVSWAKAGSVFSFTLPPAANEQQNPGYQHITIIPTVRDVNGTLTVMGSNPLPFSAFVGDQPTTYFAKKTPQNDPHTYHIEADGPILLLAGVTCAGNYLACDHAAFMPHPLPTAGKSFTFQSSTNFGLLSVLHDFLVTRGHTWMMTILLLEQTVFTWTYPAVVLQPKMYDFKRKVSRLR
ncbi:hypothetical protein COOONC_11142 [Cooperia oncophora]